MSIYLIYVRINGVIKLSPLCKPTEFYYAFEPIFLKKIEVA